MTSIAEAIPAIEPGGADLSSPHKAHRGCAAPTPRILCVVGARPSFMKIAPILRAFREHAPHVDAKLVHTGQHYDYAMNQSFFDQLGHACQTAVVRARFDAEHDRLSNAEGEAVQSLQSEGISADKVARSGA